MMTVELVHHEIFVGDETGSTDITLLNRWLKQIERKPVRVGFELSNCAGLLKAHEFDTDYNERCRHLCELMLVEKDFRPLIVASNKPTFEPSASVWVIDGWHRLSILHMAAVAHGKNVVPFWAHWVHLPELKQFIPATGVVHNRDVFEHEVKRGVKI